MKLIRFIHVYVINLYVNWGPRCLSGRASNSGARGPGFEPHDRRIVSLGKDIFKVPKDFVNTQESVAPSQNN